MREIFFTHDQYILDATTLVIFAVTANKLVVGLNDTNSHGFGKTNVSIRGADMQESCLLIKAQCEFNGLRAAARYEVKAVHCLDGVPGEMCSVIAEREVWSLPKGNDC